MVYVILGTGFEEIEAVAPVDILRRAGFPEEGIYVCGYANSVNGYLAPPEEFEVGGYEVGGAAHWYNIPQTSVESEPTVVKWFEEAAR
jgi:putative intracellular protease/amidase